MNDETKSKQKRRRLKPSEKIVFSTRVSKKFDYTFRLEALKKKITMEELLEFYQQAYHEKHERIKVKKTPKLKKESEEE